MAINIYENSISNLLIGESSVTSVYVGSDLVYSSTPPIPNYLSFKAKNDDATIGMSGSATPNVSYSFDGVDWTVWDYNDITIPNGSTLYIKGNNPNGFSTSSNNRKTFIMSGTIEANGNIMSLLYDDNFDEQLTIPNDYCFNALFSGCTSLTTTPQLPATTLAGNCYRNMFYGCTSLTTAPTTLPATTLAQQCYWGMFQGCTSLTSAPQLPATTLVTGCYRQMFRGCTSLTSAPELPATTLANYCYAFMFQGCTSLNYIKMMATDISASNCLGSWVVGVAATGTFVKNSAATWTTTGNNGVPEGWTVQTASS